MRDTGRPPARTGTGDGRIVTVASGKGGVGKTVLTALIGATLAAQGRRVLLVDGDMGLRDLDLVVGMENRVLFDIFDVATGRCFEEDAIVSVVPGLDLLPASQRYRWEDIEGDAVLTVLEDVRHRYDYILIDSPAGVGKGLYYTLDMADLILLVAEPTWVSVRDTGRLMSDLRERRQLSYALLGNRFGQTAESLPPEDWADALGAEELAGIVPYSDAVAAAAQEGRLATPHAAGAAQRALDAVATYLETGASLSPEEWARELRAMTTRSRARYLVRRRQTARQWRRGRGYR